MHTKAGRPRSLGLWMLLGDSGTKTLGAAPGRGAVAHGVKEMAADTRSELASLPPSCVFALHVDESPDTARIASVKPGTGFEPVSPDSHI